jgi:hypothetical protein
LCPEVKITVTVEETSALVLYTQVILKVAFLVATQSSPATSSLEKQAFYWLLGKHLCSVRFLLMISMSLLCITFLILFVLVLAIADMSAHAMLWASGQRIGIEQIFTTRLVQKPSSILTLLHTHLLLGYQDDLHVQYVWNRNHIVNESWLSFLS